MGLRELILDLRGLILGLRGLSFGPERTDFGPERADLGPERADMGPERGLGGGGRTDGWTDVRTYVRTYGHTDSPYSTGLRLLQFPSEPLPCLHNCYHHKILEQGKGTNNHLLPLGDRL